jgi:hypothetical protein
MSQRSPRTVPESPHQAPADRQELPQYAQPTPAMTVRRTPADFRLRRVFAAAAVIAAGGVRCVVPCMASELAHNRGAADAPSCLRRV